MSTAIKSPFTGGCQCGAVRYECTATQSEIQMFKCHCRDCQGLSGGPYAPVVLVPAGTFRITRGTIRHHITAGEAGPHQRGYCADCGSRMTGGEGPGSTKIGMTASSLDDPTWFKPEFEMWIEDTEPWDVLDPNVPHFDKYPPG